MNAYTPHTDSSGILGVILLRDHYPQVFPDARLLHPRLVETLGAYGFFPEAVRAVHAFAGEKLPRPDSAAAWVVSGLPFADDADWMGDVVTFLSDAMTTRVPLYGIAGGEQVLASALGWPSSEIRFAHKPSLRNPLHNFRSSDNLYRMVPATQSVTVCPAPQYYRDTLSLRVALASASAFVRRIAPARAIS